MESTLQILALFSAFWVAILGFAAQARNADGIRFAMGLGLGALLAHLGWAALHPGVIFEHPELILHPELGYTILPVPLGVLATAPWGSSRRRRDAYLAAAFTALPLALAVARLGCLAAGCCHGLPTTLPWGVFLGGEPPLRHPTQLYEILGLVLLFFAVSRLPRSLVAPVFLAGFGLLRFLVTPLRAAPPIGPPVLPVAVIAALWIPVGLCLSPTVRHQMAHSWRRAVRGAVG